MNVRGLLFDFDGLLVDTEGPAFRSWQEIYVEHGVELALEEWVANVGTIGSPFDPVARLESLTGREVDRRIVVDRRLARELELSALEELRDGVAEYLEAAEELGLPAAIVSSASERWVRSHIGRLSIEHVWATVVCADGDAGRAKPAPTLYLEALDLLEISAAEAVTFEDSLNGVRAAKAAGIYTVAVPNPVTAGLALHEADLVVESLAHLPLRELLALLELR
ncbi:MAG TPA: HAD-IA family hydrolase [Gaiellaceae bacterium]|nr:HAD-IA family hydrolase [Gaiellaceae bacterium]